MTGRGRDGDRDGRRGSRHGEGAESGGRDGPGARRDPDVSGTVASARWLFARLVPGPGVEFVLGDLDEEAASRLRAGEPASAVRRWYAGQLARSAARLWVDRLGALARGGRPDRSRAWRGVLGDAIRNVRRAPARGLAVVGIMALGVGANATMFGALDRLFLQPPAHVEAPDDVKRLFVRIRRFDAPELTLQPTVTYPDWSDWRELDAFSSTAAYSPGELTLGTGAAAERIPVTLATASFFPLLGIEPVIGRFYDESDDRVGAQPVAVLGHGFWQREFAGSPDAIGRSLHIGDQTYTVIGVAPPGFTGVNLDRVDAWLPLHPAGAVEEGGTEWLDSRGWYWLFAVARLAPGVSPEAAEAAATLAHRNGRSEQPDYLERDPRVELGSLILARTEGASAESRVVPWLMGVALMVLLLTCANVANLLLAGALRRRRATAVRRALGASHARLVGTVVAEATLLALLGGAAAALVAAWGGDLFRAIVFPDAGWDRGPDALRVIAFSGVLALAAGLFTGLVPGWRAGKAQPAEALRTGGRGMTRGRSRLRSGLLVVQAAISAVLLIGTGLFVLSLRAARDVDLGFDPDGVLLVSLQAEGGYPGGEEMTRMYREARRALEALPGEPAAAIATTVPFRNSRSVGSDLRVPGRDSLPRTRAGGAYINAVTGGYFEAAGLEIVRGRGIEDADDAPGAPRVAVVNETMARLVWPEGDALGACLILRDAPCATVVGIVEDHHRFELEEDENMSYYVPLAHAPYPWPPRALLIRSPVAASLAATVQRRLAAELAGVRLVTTTPFRDVVDPTYRSWQLGAALFAAFGILALLVASLGLYSVLAFDVAERRSEMGLRAALGATRARLVRFVVGDGLRLAGLGIALGLVVGAVAASRARPLLFRVSPFEPAVLIGVGTAMLVVSVAACWFPAWRASRVDPNETLRAE